ncbi:hypothetical protein QJS04_geneDACA016554 [Acorus gramineus]|uniref:Uncharacterized protein n=1 Tax=Acorus gramineus TaxID=55184 RepID=A0AAV9BN63_ACOGR|nr:hypothetical protein QJS04_geneDACA016554 [Acorus gramineus]
MKAIPHDRFPISFPDHFNFTLSLLYQSTRASTAKRVHSRQPFITNKSQIQKTSMGQSLKKLTGRVDDQETKQALESLIKEAIEKRYQKFDDETTSWSKAEFYHAVYDIVEGINKEKGGAIQISTPKTAKLEKAYRDIHRHRDGKEKLTKGQFEEILKEVIDLQSIALGQGARDTLLYIFGIPIVALIAKRQLPLSTRAISDDVFIPAVTTATVVYLAKANKI